MARLSPRLERLLLALVRAHRVEDEQGHREPIQVIEYAQGSVVLHPEWPDGDGPPLDPSDLEDLELAGMARVDHRPSGSFTVTPTDAGHRAVDKFEREKRRQDGDPTAVDLSWSALRPVLVAIVDLWESHGAPRGGLVTTAAIADELEVATDDPQLLRSLEHLARADWLEIEEEMGADGPTAAQPTSRTLESLRGWPGDGPVDTATAFLLALDERIAEAADPEEKSRLQRFRDFAADVSKSALAGAIVAGGRAAAGGG